MTHSDSHNPLSGWRLKLHEIIFEADTFSGKIFDLGLLASIFLSILVVMLESVRSVEQQWGDVMRLIEWILTICFSLEYILRLISTGRPWHYIFSFYGLVDFLSIIPTYLSIFVSGTQSLLVIRAFRLLRIFRVFKLVQFVSEAIVLKEALKASTKKITIFLGSVLTMVIVIGALMYLIEGEDNGFTSIPQSIYWAIVTLTTVGYGDIAPQTVLGKIFASLVMIAGYGIIAVPTGIVTVELAASKKTVTTTSCPECSLEGHDHDAKHCKFCGELLHPEQT